MSVTRRPVDSGEAGTGLTADSPLPEAFLRIFDELRYDPEQSTLRLVGTRNIVLAWVESYDDAGWVTAAEFVRSEDGDWSERTWVSMYGRDALGGISGPVVDPVVAAAAGRRDHPAAISYDARPAKTRQPLCQSQRELSGDPGRIRTAGLHLDRVACRPATPRAVRPV